MESPAEKLAIIMQILAGKGYRVIEAKLRVSERDDSAHISVKFSPSAVRRDNGRAYRTDIVYGQDHERMIREALNYVDRTEK